MSADRQSGQIPAARIRGGMRNVGNRVAVLSLLFVTGCMAPAINDPARIGPFFTPVNHSGDAQLPADLRRIVLLPVYAGTAAPIESAAALDPVFLTELQKQNRFEIVVLSREECLHRFHVEELSSAAVLPHNFLAELKRDFGADGVMFIDLTVFKSYRPMVVGVRAKLASITGDVRLVWTFDNVFAAADPAVANSARRYLLESDHRGVPADLTAAALQSPARFAGYAASAAFATLPPVFARATPATIR